CASLSFSFFFSPHGPLPDLHSFPTRRSSDLVPAVWHGGGPVIGVVKKAAVGQAQPIRNTAIVIAPKYIVPAISIEITGPSDMPRDRKSTRLNSSHVEISYAVFCLKKKKKKRR